MLDDGMVHLLATDAHGVKHRAPLLAEGVRAAEKWVGAEEAQRLVLDRPMAVLENRRAQGRRPRPRAPPRRPQAAAQGVWRS